MSIVHCFTGWLPEPIPLRFGHISEVWRFLKETLPKFQWPDEKQKEEEAAALLLQQQQEAELNKEDATTTADNNRADTKRDDRKEKKGAKGKTNSSMY